MAASKYLCNITMSTVAHGMKIHLPPRLGKDHTPVFS